MCSWHSGKCNDNVCSCFLVQFVKIVVYYTQRHIVDAQCMIVWSQTRMQKTSGESACLSVVHASGGNKVKKADTGHSAIFC